MFHRVARRNRRGLFAFATALVATLLLSVSVAAQQQQQVSLTATDSAITPKTVSLTVGQPVQLTIRNSGREDHNLVSEIAISNVNYVKADNDPAKLADYTARNVLDMDYKVGNTSTVVFTPTKAGTFEFFSEEQPGDRAAGMVGTFEVRAAGAAAAAPSQLPRTGDVGPNTLSPWLAAAAAGLIGAGLIIRRAARGSRN
jgi:uncharacterized cupredoxin-like copper-binding protein